MKTKKSKYLCYIFCFMLSAINQSCGIIYREKPTFIGKIKKQINTIETYHVSLNTFIFKDSIKKSALNNININKINILVESRASLYGVSGKKMKVETICKLSTFDVKTYIKLIYDGIWLWIEKQNEMSHQGSSSSSKITAYKVHIPDVSPDPSRMPFHTIYGVSGIGLYRYKDLPGTLLKIINDYEFSKNNFEIINNKDIMVIGKIKESILKNDQSPYSATEAVLEIKNCIMSRMNYCTIWIEHDKKRIISYAFGRSKDEINMCTQIEYKKINSSLPIGVFEYEPIYGIDVKDITSLLLQSGK
jgi:hypothetical protein